MKQRLTYMHLFTMLFALLYACASIHMHAMGPAIILNTSLNTPNCRLLRACNGQHENIAAVQSALEARANVNVQDGMFFTPLHYAVNNDYRETVLLLIRHKADLEARAGTTAQATPLFCALRDGRTAIAQVLIEHKAHVNACAGRDKEAPLYTAMIRNHLDIAELLCFRGARALSADFERRLSPGEQDYIRQCTLTRKRAQMLLNQRRSPLLALLPVRSLVQLVNDYATNPKLTRIITEEQARSPQNYEPETECKKCSRCSDCAIS